MLQFTIDIAVDIGKLTIPKGRKRMQIVLHFCENSFVTTHTELQVLCGIVVT